jgi:hypothetical protein
MIMKRTDPATLIAFTAAMLLPGLAAGAKLAPIAVRAAEKPLTTRLHEADKVFVAEVVNRKLIKDDWCHADLKVTQAIKGVKLGELVPVVWRPKVARYNAEENQLGLAVLKPAHQKRYWLRADTFVDITFAEQAAYSLGKTVGILREYVKGATLTKEQEKIVIELANKRGIKKIAKITTYYLLPSSDRGISVSGVDQVKGREVLQPMLTVTYKDWTSQSRGPKKDDLQSGDFWAGKPAIRKTTILMVGKKEYRVGSPHGLSVEQCESILKRLQTGKYTLTDGKNGDRLKGVDWNSPKSFSKFGENINVSFSARGRDSGWYSLRIKLTGDKLVVSEVQLAMP